MNKDYANIVSLVERLHRQWLDVVRSELDRNKIRDINSVQALILLNMGAQEGEEMSVGDLTARGCYLGSNVSYNLGKLVENGYVLQQRSQHDRRSTDIRLSAKGLTLRSMLVALCDRHASELGEVLNGPAGFRQTSQSLSQIEQFWRSKAA
jgi:DNA-binding MarR family transcriptional regulator